MRKLDWVKTLLLSLLFAGIIVVGLIVIGRYLSGETNRALIINLQTRIESVEQSLKIEQDNWRMLSDETRQILDNDGNFKYQLGALEERLDNITDFVNKMNKRITKLEPKPPGDMP